MASGELPPPRRRRSRTWLVVAAVVAVVGLVTAGLLFWAPWKPKGPPPAPTDVHVVATTDESVTIEWSAPPDREQPDSYEIITGDIQGPPASVSGAETTYERTGLDPATSYTLQVRATWKDQHSPYSAKVGATTTLPPSPAAVSVEGAAPDSVTIGWSPPPGKPTPDRYDVVTGDTHTVVGSVPGTGETVYQWNGLSPTTDYPFQVVAYWGNQRSEYSDQVVARTTPPVGDGRLSGSLPVQLTVTASDSSIGVGTAWSDTWDFTPSCDTGPCATTLDGGVTPSGYATHSFQVPLNRDGATYTGSVNAHITHCGPAGSEVDVNDTVTVSITVTSGSMTGGTWVVSGWNGTLKVDAPYTQTGPYYCSPQSFTMSLSSAG